MKVVKVAPQHFPHFYIFFPGKSMGSNLHNLHKPNKIKHLGCEFVSKSTFTTLTDHSILANFSSNPNPITVPLDHLPHQFPEPHLGFPPQIQNSAGVALQQIDFGGPHQRFIKPHVLAPI